MWFFLLKIPLTGDIDSLNKKHTKLKKKKIVGLARLVRLVTLVTLVTLVAERKRATDPTPVNPPIMFFLPNTFSLPKKKSAKIIATEKN